MTEDLDFPEVPDVDIGGVDMDLDPSLFGTPSDFDADLEPRYVRPPLPHSVKEDNLAYEDARRLARAVDLDFGARTFAIVAGSFIFGDFIEALLVEKNFLATEMTLSTLSMSENNVDSLATLMEKGYLQNFNLIISSYFYSHERHNLIPYLYKSLDRDNRFQLAVAGTHAKTCIFETECGRKIVIHGSANLRSSGNIEQVMIEENPTLYDFNKAYQSRILEKYQTIRKEIRGKQLWHLVARRRAPGSTVASEPGKAAQPRPEEKA